MDSYGQNRSRVPFSRARPRSRFTDNTLSTVDNDTISSISTASVGWTDSEDDYRLPSPSAEPVNPFFRSPRPAPEDVFRFGRRRGLVHFMKPEVQDRPLQQESEFEREIKLEDQSRPMKQEPAFERKPKFDIQKRPLQPLQREPKFNQQHKFERKPEPKPELEPQQGRQQGLEEEGEDEEADEEVTSEATIQVLKKLPAPKPKLTTKITMPSSTFLSEIQPKNDLEERFRTVSASLEDTKEAIERMEKQILTSVQTPPPSPSPQLHITFSIPRNPFGRYWPLVQRILYLFLIWLCCESTLCAMYCKPEYSSKVGWKPFDPFFGQAIPWKLDDWTGWRVSRAWRDYWNY